MVEQTSSGAVASEVVHPPAHIVPRCAKAHWLPSAVYQWQTPPCPGSHSSSGTVTAALADGTAARAAEANRAMARRTRIAGPLGSRLSTVRLAGLVAADA